MCAEGYVVRGSGCAGTVEADTARDVVSWPEEVDDFRAALRSNFDADNSNCSVDVVVGSCLRASR